MLPDESGIDADEAGDERSSSYCSYYKHAHRSGLVARRAEDNTFSVSYLERIISEVRL